MEDNKNVPVRYYISSISGNSGICKYSKDFYELVLKNKGYVFVDSNESITTILTKISSKDHAHIEIGIFSKKEIEILLVMLKVKYKNIAVTLHDPPLLKFPFYEFSNSLLNKASKFYDIYINKFKAAGKYLSQLSTIYVLSKKGAEAVRSRYKINNVRYLPHIINEKEVKRNNHINNNFISLGFIGTNKGIEYALQLHQQLLLQFPEIIFYIVGTALGKQKQYYDFLKENYKNNIHFLGYVPEEEMDDIFDKTTFSFILFKNYKFYIPISGSILYSLKKGKILFTNNTNAVEEIIENGKNGFFLTGKINKDVKTVSEIINNKELLNNIKQEVYNTMVENYNTETVSKYLV